MKRNIFLICISLFLSINLNAQDTNKVYAKINKVTIYNFQAQVEKSIEVSLKKGFNEFILAGNSNKLETQSIQFNNSNDFMIMEFSPYSQVVRADKVAEEKLSEASRKRVKILKDSIELLVYKLTEIKNTLSSLDKEKRALENMKVISIPNEIDSVGKIKEGLNYFHDKMIEVNSMIQKKEKESEDLNKQIDIEKSNLNLILQDNNQDDKLNKTETYIKVNLYCEQPIKKAKLEYSYMVYGIDWEAYYDIKFTTNKDSVDLILKANLKQNTQEDWDDIKLVFSTEEPNNQGQVSEVQPEYLIIKPRYYNNQTQVNSYNYSQNTSGTARGESGMVTYVNGVAKKGSVNIPEQADEKSLEEINELNKKEVSSSNSSILKKDKEVSRSMIGKEYQVPMNYSIKNNDNSKIIPLESMSTKISYKYSTVPKKDRIVYLSALLPNWEGLELMNAMAKIYVDNNFVSETWINPLQTDDTLSIPVGKEKRIAVNRKSSKTKPEKVGLMGNNAEVVYTITLDIKNNTQKNIDIDLQDQIPLSNSETITVTPIDKANAKYDEKTGKLSWDLSLKALEAKTITFTYSVRYPRLAEIILN